MGTEGRDYLIHISSDGTSGGTETELECQSDVTINTGKSVSRTVAKNCTHTYQQDDGFSVTSTFLEERPLGTAQALLWTAHDAGSQVYAWIKDSNTGGLSFAGPFKVAISEISAPVNGTATHSFTLSQDGAITRATVSS